MRILPIVLSACCFLGTAKAEPAGLGDQAKNYEVIKNAPEFCATAVGVAGSTPAVVYAFRDLIADPAADAAFKSLLTEAKLPGQLYALCGLWFTDPLAFKTEVEKFRSMKGEVRMVDGCEIAPQRVSELVESKAPGVVRLKDNKQTILAWSRERKSPGPTSYDIVGGAWPSMFRDEGGFKR